MTTRGADTLLWDAITAAERLARFVAGRTIDDYFADELLRAGVERQCEIIGEALTVLRRTAPAVASQIGDLSQAIGFRNILVHAYFTVDDAVAWDIAVTKIPPLARQLRAVVGAADGGGTRPSL